MPIYKHSKLVYGWNMFIVLNLHSSDGGQMAGEDTEPDCTCGIQHCKL